MFLFKKNIFSLHALVSFRVRHLQLWQKLLWKKIARSPRLSGLNKSSKLLNNLIWKVPCHKFFVWPKVLFIPRMVVLLNVLKWSVLPWWIEIWRCLMKKKQWMLGQLSPDGPDLAILIRLITWLFLIAYQFEPLQPLFKVRD